MIIGKKKKNLREAQTNRPTGPNVCLQNINSYNKIAMDTSKMLTKIKVQNKQAQMMMKITSFGKITMVYTTMNMEIYTND